MAMGTSDNPGVRIADLRSDLVKIVSYLEGNPTAL